MRSAPESAVARRIRLALGIFFATQAMLGAIIRCEQDRGYESFWLSQASYSLGACGLVGNSALLMTTAFCCVFVIHGLWVFDAVIGLATDDYPFRITEFARDATVFDWIVLQPHFYFAFVLGAYLLATRRVHRCGWMGSAVFLTVLVAISRIALPREANVNLAFAPIAWLANGPLGSAWHDGTIAYLGWLIGGATLFAFLPANLVFLAARRFLEPNDLAPSGFPRNARPVPRRTS